MVNFKYDIRYSIIVKHTLSREAIADRLGIAIPSQYGDSVKLSTTLFPDLLDVFATYCSRSLEVVIPAKHYLHYQAIEDIIRSVLATEIKCEWFVRMNGTFHQAIDLNDMYNWNRKQFYMPISYSGLPAKHVKMQTAFKTEKTIHYFYITPSGSMHMMAMQMRDLADIHRFKRFIADCCAVVVQYLALRDVRCTKVVTS
jgi:hypothetical protein